MVRINDFLKKKQFVIFFILAVLIILAAVFAPVITQGVDPLEASMDVALQAPCKTPIFVTHKM